MDLCQHNSGDVLPRITFLFYFLNVPHPLHCTELAELLDLTLKLCFDLNNKRTSAQASFVEMRVKRNYFLSTNYFQYPSSFYRLSVIFPWKQFYLTKLFHLLICFK